MTILDSDSRITSPGAVADPALFALLQTLADNKYWLGRRYAEWCTAAPTLESAVAAAAMAQDEIGHARSLYPMFRHFVGHDVEPEDRQVFHALALLDQPFGGWVDFVATNFLADTALTTMFQAALTSSFDDLRNRARRITGEEQVHWLHGKGWVRRLAGDSETTRTSIEKALARQWPEVLMWFGVSDDGPMGDLRQRSVIALSPDELRAAFVAQISSVTDPASIRMADVAELPWDRWDGERRRLQI